MNYSEVCTKSEKIKAFFEASDEQCIISSHEGRLCINDYVAFPVYEIDSSTSFEEDIILSNDHDDEIGILCPLKLNGFPYEIQQLTVFKIICMINDIELEELGNSDQYFFKNHYALILKQYVIDYKDKYFHSSAIWGGFSHESNVLKYCRSPSKIKMISGISIPTPRHKADLRRAISSSTGFDRFLKYYHQLELLFDLIFVSRMKALPHDSLRGFGDLIKDYQKKELDNLKNMMKEYIDDTQELMSVISKKFNSTNQNVMTSIFQDHSKDGNPLLVSGENKWPNFCAFISGGVFEPQAAKECKLIKVNSVKDFDYFIINLSAYWIYRVRCSIAHSKIGEFIFDDEHEEFIVDFIEILMKISIGKIFSNEKLKTLFHR